MTEKFYIDSAAPKVEKYEQLLPQLISLTQGESDTIANLANIVAVLKETFNWWWVGFYFVKGDELVLGPFQGPVACTRIKFGKGVCGNSWKEKTSILVPDVHQFVGHIACSSSSVAEIVVPIMNQSAEVVAVLDVDSECYDVLDATDVYYLEKIANLVSETLH